MIWIHSDSRYYTSANAAFEFRAYNGNSNLAVLPASEDPLGGLVLSFQMRLNPVHSNPERCTLVVGVMPNPYDIDSFVGIDTLHPDYLYRRYDVSLASYTGPWRHLALKYLDSESRITYIDDLALTSCRPTQERPVSVADSSIGLRWQRLGYSGIFIVVGPAVFTCVGGDIQAYGLVFGRSGGHLHFKTQALPYAEIAEGVGCERKHIFTLGGLLLLRCRVLFIATRGRQGQECTKYQKRLFHVHSGKSYLKTFPRTALEPLYPQELNPR